MVGGRCLIQSVDVMHATRSNPLECLIQEVSTNDVYVRLWIINVQNFSWFCCDEYEVVSVLPNDTPLSRDVECMRIIHALRSFGVAGSVCLLNDNEEGTGLDNCAVDIANEATVYETRRFYGDSVLCALMAAAQWLDDEKQDDPLYRKILKQNE